jgi:hypothetical protein
MQLLLIIFLCFFSCSIGSNRNVNHACNISTSDCHRIHQIIDEFLMGEEKHLLTGNQAVGAKVLKTDSIESYTHLSDLSLDPDGEIITDKVFRSSNGDASISVSTGSIITGGGIGVAKDSFIGGKLELSQSTLTSFVVSSNAASNDVSSGAVTVVGGVGIGGSMYAGGCVSATCFRGLYTYTLWNLKYSQYSEQTVSNSIVKTNLVGSGLGLMSLSNEVFSGGMTFVIFASGFYRTAANQDNTIQLDLESDGTTIANFLTSLIPDVSIGNELPWSVESRCTCNLVDPPNCNLSCNNRLQIGVGDNNYDYIVSQFKAVPLPYTTGVDFQFYATWNLQSTSNVFTLNMLTLQFGF